MPSRRPRFSPKDTTSAPAARATAAVPSVEPSSTTSRSAPGSDSCASPSTDGSEPSSFQAGANTSVPDASAVMRRPYAPHAASDEGGRTTPGTVPAPPRRRPGKIAPWNTCSGSADTSCGRPTRRRSAPGIATAWASTPTRWVSGGRGSGRRCSRRSSRRPTTSDRAPSRPCSTSGSATSMRCSRSCAPRARTWWTTHRRWRASAASAGSPIPRATGSSCGSPPDPVLAQALDPRRVLLDHAPDPLARHRAARAEPLGELVDAQLLEHPLHLAQRDRQRPSRRPLGDARPVQRLELLDRAHAVEVAGRVVGQALETALGGLQVALEVAEPGGAGRGQEPGGQQPVELGLDVAARGRDRLRGERLEAPADGAGEVENPRRLQDDRARAVVQLTRDAVAEPPEAGLVPRRAARLGDEAVDRRRLGVLEQGPDAAVRRARERELGVLGQAVEHLAQR